MPTQQRVRADEQRLPRTVPREAGWPQPERHGGLRQTRTSDLAAKNRQLVSKHNDLELLELTRTHTQRSDGERTLKQQMTRTRADSLQQDADEARLYGREVSSDGCLDNRADLRTPQGRSRALSSPSRAAG